MTGFDAKQRRTHGERMTTILLIGLLSLPIAPITASLWKNRHDQSVIVCTEIALYVIGMLGYLHLAMTLVPAREPGWMQAIGFLSFAAVATSLAPITVRRISRRLTAAETRPTGRETA